MASALLRAWRVLRVLRRMVSTLLIDQNVLRGMRGIVSALLIDWDVLRGLHRIIDNVRVHASVMLLILYGCESNLGIASCRCRRSDWNV